jgi:hypothetical protein
MFHVILRSDGYFLSEVYYDETRKGFYCDNTSKLGSFGSNPVFVTSFATKEKAENRQKELDEAWGGNYTFHVLDIPDEASIGRMHPDHPRWIKE